MRRAVILTPFIFAWAVILLPPLVWLCAEAIAISACGIILLASLVYVYRLLENKS